MVCCALIGGFAYLLVMVFIEPQGVNPFTLSISNVQEIIIKPEEYSSLVSSNVDLHEQDIDAVCSTLRTATPITPNHPSAVWRCKLAIATKDGKSVTVDVSNNRGYPNGILVGWWSPNLGLNLGTHRCDKLGDVIESVVNSRKNPAQPVEQTRASIHSETNQMSEAVGPQTLANSGHGR